MRVVQHEEERRGRLYRSAQGGKDALLDGRVPDAQQPSAGRIERSGLRKRVREVTEQRDGVVVQRLQLHPGGRSFVALDPLAQ